jgi:uncharacterized protein (DUF433 family)
LITKTPGVCGGEACVRDHRIPVWTIVNYHRLGATDEKILESYPSLSPADLEAAFQFARDNPIEVERAIWRNDTVMIDRGQNGHTSSVVRKGRDLGFTDDEIRESFEPPLSLAEFEAALAETPAR